MKISGTRIVAVCSQPLATAKALAAEIHGATPAVFSDFGRMLDEAELDVLYICLPPFAHSGQFEAAAARGIHIFIEKPIALTLERARSMVAAARRAKIVTQVGYHMRFGGAVRRLKTMIDDGTAGPPTLFDGRFECNSLHSPWWRDIRKSGGQVFEQAIHLYDLSLHLLGKPRIVSGFTSNLCHGETEGYSVEDTSAATIRFSTGALASISATNCAVPLQWNVPFTVVCEKLTGYFANHNEATFVFTAGAKPRTLKVATAVDPFLEEDRAFIAAARGRKAPTATVEEGLTGLRMVAGVQESSLKNGAPVRMR
jgi:predicted dehydrogenase